MFDAIQISPDVYWVGVIDWNERIFDGHAIDRGTTYNAYLILDEHVTLIDTCKPTHFNEMRERIQSVIDPSKIEYIVSNHGEMDHSGSIPSIMKLAPNATIASSKPKGVQTLQAFYGDAYEYLPVASGDTLCIGKRTLTFTATPMVHWPDNMVTYSDVDRILFSNDAFGQHIATMDRFDDETDLAQVMDEAKRYYANIVMPFSKNVQKVMPTVKSLDIAQIAPSHGVIWRSNVATIVDAYSEWCLQEPKQEAVVIYDSMYGTTEKMAQCIAQTLAQEGYDTTLMNLEVNDVSRAITAIMDAKIVAVGSPTLNQGMMPTVAAFLESLKGLTPHGRSGLAFGSYGWIKNGQQEIAEMLEKAHYQMLAEPISHLWTIDEEGLAALSEQIKHLV